MAKIVLSDQAPSGESIHFSLANVDFDLGGSGKGSKKSYDTDDRTVLSNAAVHPWLAVEYDQVDEVGLAAPSTQVAPQDDVQSAAGPRANIAFDADEIRKVEEAKVNDVGAITGLNANLDQDEPVTTGPVAETVAATDDNAGDKS